MIKSMLAVLTMASMTVPVRAVDATGDWRVNDGTALIRVAPCFDLKVDLPAESRADPKDVLCGIIAWTKGGEGAQNAVDENNPDPAKRARPIMGLPILTEMKYDVQKSRWDGEVYNAKDGKIYTSHLILKSDDIMRIEGCVFGGLICGGEDWTRVQLPDPTFPGATPMVAARPPAPAPSRPVPAPSGAQRAR
ncbi:MAG TPA: DUF2147 domain-containing protein [Xanthobacteraceae bacterium]|jgi:uncharacterized protein (DUF2147 family)|nr:DUF2147 domain-containing protein [Xanthobacteraceae bacterium]